jgi:hypothetical protein
MFHRMTAGRISSETPEAPLQGWFSPQFRYQRNRYSLAVYADMKKADRFVHKDRYLTTPIRLNHIEENPTCPLTTKAKRTRSGAAILLGGTRS